MTLPTETMPRRSGSPNASRNSFPTCSTFRPISVRKTPSRQRTVSSIIFGPTEGVGPISLSVAGNEGDIRYVDQQDRHAPSNLRVRSGAGIYGGPNMKLPPELQALIEDIVACGLNSCLGSRPSGILFLRQLRLSCVSSDAPQRTAGDLRPAIHAKCGEGLK